MKNKYKLKIKSSRWGPKFRLNATISYVLFLLFSWSFIQTTNAQTSLQEMRGYIEEVAKDNNVNLNDIAEIRISDQNVSTLSQIENIYFCQQYKGIDIANSNMSLHLTKDKKVVKFNERFVKDLRGRINASAPRITAIEAIKNAATNLRLTIRKPLQAQKSTTASDFHTVYSDGGISQFDITTKLIYQENTLGQLALAWDFHINEIKADHAWNFRVDATDGSILSKIDLMDNCRTGHHSHDDEKCNSHTENHEAGEQPLLPYLANKSSMVWGGYRVLPMPVENPEDGPRVLINDPDDAIASPFGWHDVEFTDTRGNNIDAFKPGSSPPFDFRPDGGSSLNFDFPYMQNDPVTYREAAITNAFYWTNLAHDILFHYGFDEASGNFQKVNYTSNGIGGDAAEIRCQIGTNCNAGFATQPDGILSYMNVYICDNGPEVQDGCMNNTTLIHEYVHGLTRRLIGGPAVTACLNNAETGKEGWSDWYGLMFTIEPTDTRFDDRYYGNWFYDDPDGIRPNPYSLNMAVNDHTYASIASLGSVHSRGSVWAIMLWEMAWDLIDTYGYDADLHYGTAGNNIALQLVTEGLKLAPCNPGFVDARDAIIAADQALYAGANRCLIWAAFARRGLGFSADQGSASSSTDGTEAFDLPLDCDCPNTLNISGVIPSNLYEAGLSITSDGTVNSGATVTFKAGVQIQLNPGFQAVAGSDFNAFIAPCAMFAPPEDPNYARLSDYSPAVIIAEEELSKETNGLVNIENYPNPFAERTTFKIELEYESQVILSIYDLAGKLIATPINKTTMASGTHLIEFENKKLSNGIYYYKLSSENAIITKKMILNK